jgi:hypothetical protein
MFLDFSTSSAIAYSCERTYLGSGFLHGAAICQSSRHFWDFRYPTTITLAFDLNLESQVSAPDVAGWLSLTHVDCKIAYCSLLARHGGHGDNWPSISNSAFSFWKIWIIASSAPLTYKTNSTAAADVSPAISYVCTAFEVGRFELPACYGDKEPIPGLLGHGL